MLKGAKIDARISSEGENMQNLDLVLKSQDINNNAIELSFGDLELDDTFDVTILSIFSKSGSQTTNRALIKDGKAYFKFDTSLISQDERIYNYVYINQVDKTADVISFSFRVALSEIDKEALPVAEVYDFRYEEILEDFEAKLDAYMDALPDIIGDIEDGLDIDLTAYALKTDLVGYALKEDIPVIDLTGYATELYVDNKVGSIDIPEIDLSEYAKLLDIPDVSQFITMDDLPEGQEVDLTGYATEEYVDNKVDSIEIPEVDLEGYATEVYVDGKIASIEIPEVDLEGYATEDYVNNKVDSIDIPEVDLSGYAEKTELEDYARKTEIPNVDGFITLDDIPEVDLTGLASEEYVDSKVASIPEPDLSDYAKRIEIPDTSKFITMDDLPEDKDTIYDDSEVRGLIDNKQDKLVAGENISIEGNVISSSGGSGGGSSEELNWVIPEPSDFRPEWGYEDLRNRFMYAITDDGKIHLKGTLRINTNNGMGDTIIYLPSDHTPTILDNYGTVGFTDYFPIYGYTLSGGWFNKKLIQEGVKLATIRTYKLNNNDVPPDRSLVIGASYSASSGINRYYIPYTVIDLKNQNYDYSDSYSGPRA